MRRVVGRASAICLVSLVFPSGLLACKSEPGGEGASCTKKEDCASDLSCLDGTCTKLEADAKAEPTGYCATLANLSGSWIFDTTVIGAEDLAPRGINGHFEMNVSVDNCTAKIDLTKTGYDDVVFAKGKVQRSEAELSESKLIPAGAEATVSLKGKPSHTMTFVVRDGQLFGHYHYAESEWTRAGIWGYLRGVKAGEELAAVEEFEVQPCEVQCLTQCDATRRRSDTTLDEAALTLCMGACGSEKPVVGCGPGTPLHEQLVVAVNGPAASLDELCKKAGTAIMAADGRGPNDGDMRCEKEPKIKDKATARKLGKRRLDGSFDNAQLVQIGYFDAGYTGHIVLALQTAAGWFWTDSLADVSMSGVGGMSVSTRSMTLRPRDMLSAPGREVISEITIEVSDSDLGVNEVSIDTTKRVVLCATGSPPTCVAMTTNWSSDRTLIDDANDDPKKHPDLRAEKGEVYIAVLPGDLVSVSAPADARPADRELIGMYAWPK